MSNVLKLSRPVTSMKRLKHVRLNMIVKNEAHVIERCLRSVLDGIDSWCIVDTGSTDGTQEKIVHLLKGIPGVLHERKWVDFGYNRNEALQLAKDQGADALALFIDADEVFCGDTSKLGESDYFLGDVMCDGILNPRILSARLDKNFLWFGEVHEILVPASVYPLPPLKTRQLTVSLSDGGRHRDSEWVKKDLSVMKRQVEQFPISHNMLIYAKMLEMAGELQDALYYYEQCINAEGDPEEQWHARIRRAFMLWRLERPVLEVCQAFMDAVDARPHRAEGWRDLAGFLEAHGNHIAAATARKHYSELPIPDDVMYVEPCLYGGVA